MTDVTLTVTVKPDTAARIIALLGGPAGVESAEYKARDDRRYDYFVAGGGGKGGTGGASPVTLADDDDGASDFRAYGQPSDGRSRRTKEEMKLDEKIEALWAQVSDEPGMPKAIPTDRSADDVLAELTEIAKKQVEDGFDVGDDEDEEEEVLDLEEFRAIIVKHSKKIGGKALAKIMAPHKNPGEVPESERRDYADKIIEAAEAAS